MSQRAADKPRRGPLQRTDLRGLRQALAAAPRIVTASARVAHPAPCAPVPPVQPPARRGPGGGPSVAAAAGLSAADVALFRAAVASVTPLSDDRVRVAPAPPSPVPMQRLRDEQQALRETLSDALDLDHLLETDAALSWRQNGIGADVLRRLRRGHWTLQGELDLHGLRRDDARTSLADFLREATRRGWRCVRVIHGKGLGSPGREPVLKDKVRRWLMQRDDVLAFVQARPADGGAGALVVLLRAPQRLTRGGV